MRFGFRVRVSGLGLRVSGFSMKLAADWPTGLRAQALRLHSRFASSDQKPSTKFGLADASSDGTRETSVRILLLKRENAITQTIINTIKFHTGFLSDLSIADQTASSANGQRQNQFLP